VPLNLPHIFSLFFSPVKSVLGQLVPSPSFSLPGAASHPIDVTTSPCRVTLPSHEDKMSSLPLFHLPVMLRPVGSPLESKPKYWIHTTAIGHHPQIVRLSPSTTIKNLSQHWPLSPPIKHISIFSPH
jgi:hypothetical protein